MLIFIVCLVSVNILMVKTENDVVRVIIREGTQGSCIVQPSATSLTYGTKFNLEVISDFFITESVWTHKDETTVLQNLEKSSISVIYNKTKHGTKTGSEVLKYNYLHTGKVTDGLEGNWTFSFKYLKQSNPWSPYSEGLGSCTCNISVKLKKRTLETEIGASGTSKPDGSGEGYAKKNMNETWVIVLLSLCVLFLVVQSSYILYGKVKSRRAKRNNDEDPISPKSSKGKRSKPTTNIADRPPLPLPPDEVIQITAPPQSPISPGPIRKHLFPTAPPMLKENSYSTPSEPGPLALTQSYKCKAIDSCVEELRTPGFSLRHMDGAMVPKQSYRNEALDTSVEELRTPGFPRKHMDGAMVTKQSYRNKALDTSAEELRSPGFPRRFMDGPLVPKQSYINKALEASSEELRSPGFPRRFMDGPIVPKQTYGNSVKVSDDSDEEHKSPGFARRQIEAKFAQLPPKGVAPSKSFKLPKPLPRLATPPTLEEVPEFNPAHRPEPVPPLHPKKMPVFPQPAPFRKQDPSRMSDEEWQYEQLEPSSKYLNNFSTTNNYNI